MDRHGLRVDGRNHLIAGRDDDHLHTCLPDLVSERILMRLLNDDFGLGEMGQVGDGFEAGLVILGQHGGIADHNSRRRAGCY